MTLFKRTLTLKPALRFLLLSLSCSEESKTRTLNFSLKISCNYVCHSYHQRYRLTHMFSLSKHNAPDFLPCSQRLFSGFSDFSFSQKLTIPNWLSICNSRKSLIIHLQILHTELHAFNRSSFYKFPLPFLLVKY